MSARAPSGATTMRSLCVLYTTKIISASRLTMQIVRHTATACCLISAIFSAPIFSFAISVS